MTSFFATLYPNNPGMQQAFAQLDKEVVVEDVQDVETVKTMRTVKGGTDVTVKVVYGIFGVCVLGTLLLSRHKA